MWIDNWIREKARGLGPGMTSRQICPFCNAAHEASFSIRRDEIHPWKLWFRCWRGTCPGLGDERRTAGMVEDREGAQMVLWLAEEESGVSKELPTHEKASHHILSALQEKYNISESMWNRQGIRFEKENLALCMPWLDHDQKQIGWVEKRFKESAYKSHHELVHREAATRLGWPRVPVHYLTLDQRAIVVLVEDLISAYRLLEQFGDESQIYPLALLGADISIRDAALVSAQFGKGCILLDPDQWPTGAMRVLKRFASLPIDMRATSLNADPKDAEPVEIEALRRSLEEMFRG